MDKSRCSTTSEQDVQPSVARFTPGPWAHGIDGVNQQCIVAPTTGRIVARADFSGNRDLISASPDLYAALIAAQEELRLIRMKDHGTIYNPVLSTQIALALDKAVPQTVLGTPSEAQNTESSPNTTISPTDKSDG